MRLPPDFTRDLGMLSFVGHLVEINVVVFHFVVQPNYPFSRFPHDLCQGPGSRVLKVLRHLSIQQYHKVAIHIAEQTDSNITDQCFDDSELARRIN